MRVSGSTFIVQVWCWIIYLAHKVCSFILVLLVYNDGILPDGVVTLICLPGLQLGNNLKLFLLLEIFIKCEGIVLLLLFASSPSLAFA